MCMEICLEVPEPHYTFITFFFNIPTSLRVTALVYYISTKTTARCVSSAPKGGSTYLELIIIIYPISSSGDFPRRPFFPLFPQARRRFARFNSPPRCRECASISPEPSKASRRLSRSPSFFLFLHFHSSISDVMETCALFTYSIIYSTTLIVLC